MFRCQLFVHNAFDDPSDVLAGIECQEVVNADLSSCGKLPLLGDLYVVPIFQQSATFDLNLDPA
jgi:hypothetical protein